MVMLLENETLVSIATSYSLSFILAKGSTM